MIKFIFFLCMIFLSITFFITSFFNILPFSFYALFIALYFINQLLFALLNRNNINKLKDSNAPIILLIVGYRENEEYWDNCIKSIINQKYNNIFNIIISIDGDEEDDLYMKIIAENLLLNTDLNFIVLLNKHNGKRSAISAGLTYINQLIYKPKYTLFIDSDTVLEPDAVQHLVNCIDASDNNGCATGNLLVFDNHFLGKVINARYGYAFNIERSALSYFGVMNCCSGPLSIYRTEVMDNNFIIEFNNQKFLGVKCGPGDDRHLTNMFLYRGYKSKQTHLSIGYTEAPKTFIRFIKQQTRWMRSFFREQYWQILAINKQHPFLAVVTQYEILYPVFVFIWLCTLIPNNSSNLLLRVISTTIGVMLIRTLILICMMKDCLFIANMIYLPMFMLILLPLKIYALCTMRVMNWITSSRLNIVNKIDFELFIITILVFIWNSSICYSIYNKIPTTFINKLIL